MTGVVGLEGAGQILGGEEAEVVSNREDLRLVVDVDVGRRGEGRRSDRMKEYPPVSLAFH